ncbi:meiotic recombination protein SPO11-like [Oppia nitens]|uniref:meiotic recombination protein SPO11-like n=1 Tax=Oppia nitens TaxID=1686743 RepID=UPI0023DA8020|nr:meiotic recombination protein SPO11-like [Oppia nitens]
MMISCKRLFESKVRPIDVKRNRLSDPKDLWSVMPWSTTCCDHTVTPFTETIHFESFSFRYDKHFLDQLKQLTNELKVFTSDQTKAKSRVFGKDITHKTTAIEKEALIEKINKYIKTIDHFLKGGHRKTKKKMNQMVTQSQIVCNENNEPIISVVNDVDNQPNELIIGSEIEIFSENVSQFMRQFIESIGESDYRFTQSNDKYVIKDSNDRPINNSNEIRSKSEVMRNMNECKDSEQYHPTLEIVNRHKWANTSYKIGTGIILKADPQNKVRTQKKRQKQLRFVLQKIKGLIVNDIYCTKRDLYYQNVMLFERSQRVVDEIIDDLACSLRVSRTKLHIASSTRGLVFGHLKFQNTNGVYTDCLSSPNGIAIPNDTEKLCRMHTNARFVLIVEKDATFQQLIDLRIHEKYPLIMVTGHGYPDLNTRAFVHILWNSFEIPIFGLVDGDAHGLEILCTFRHGSLALSYESPNLVVPAIKWLGILPIDIRDYKLSPNVQIPLKDNDRKKIEDLKARKYMLENYQWTQQLNILLKIGKKVEIQSLAEHSPTFLLDVYLPSKLRYGKWI